MEKVTITISKEVYNKLKDELTENNTKEINSYNDFIGKKLFFRTVTYHILGKVVKIVGDVFILETASWIADSGRFSDAIKTGVLSEIEPLGDWMINFQAVTDFGNWNHELPIKQK